MYNSFSDILYEAIEGNHEALEMILEMYDPLIHKYSYIDKEYDEDLNQYLLMRIAIKISKFKIRD